MKTFSDSASRTWAISLTIDAAKRVRKLLNVNLLELEAGDPPLLTRLATDMILLCDVIYALVKPQTDAQGVSDEQFGAALGGDAILAAQTALYEELVDFFRQLGRTDLTKAVDAQRRMIDVAIRTVETRIEHLDLEAEIGRTLGTTAVPLRRSEAETDGEPSTSSPASSGSIPAP